MSAPPDAVDVTCDELLVSVVRWLGEHRDRIQATEPRSADAQWLAWWRGHRLAVRSAELRGAILAAHPQLVSERLVARRLSVLSPSHRGPRTPTTYGRWLVPNRIRGGMVQRLTFGARRQVALQVYELRVEALAAAGLQLPPRFAPVST